MNRKKYYSPHYSKQYLERLIGSHILKISRVPRRNNHGAIIRYKSDTKNGQHHAGDARMCRPHSVDELFKYYDLVEKDSLKELKLKKLKKQSSFPQQNPFNNDDGNN